MPRRLPSEQLQLSADTVGDLGDCQMAQADREKMQDCLYRPRLSAGLSQPYMCKNPITNQNCEKCLGSHFLNCTLGKCIHGSFWKICGWNFGVGFLAWKWRLRYIDRIICCSAFMKSKIDSDPLFAGKTEVLHNFIVQVERKDTPKKDYVLYFGRFQKKKGLACW